MNTSHKHGFIRRLDGRPSKRKASMSDETIKNIMDVDVSITMGSDEVRRFLDNSSMMGPGTPTQFFMPTDPTESEDLVYNQQKTEQLFSHFLEILQSRTNDSEIFDTVKDLIQICTDTLSEITKPLNGRNIRDLKETDHEWLMKERDTWRLLYALYKDRLIVQKDASDYDDLPLLGSEKEIVEHLYANNANLREYQLIVDWLEQSASEQGTTQIGYYTDRTVGWENTLLQLKNVDQTIFGNGKEIVKSLDPDAPNREKLRLHDLDTEDQKRLSRQVIFMYCIVENNFLKCFFFRFYVKYVKAALKMLKHYVNTVDNHGKQRYWKVGDYIMIQISI